ncbi:hypothetical protein [uncultured Shewanella sp.]|uniref:DUF6911 family protein n=1 Tax=uncultured Shewanella sp. TaxID=173975 RepID=UPI00260437A0|nr:hypothetical protein [uncultured Shewanella sp.]
MANIVPYTVDMAFRAIGNTKKQYVKEPSWNDVYQCVEEIEKGRVEFLSLVGPEVDNTHLAIIAKPGHYHIGIFIDEDEEYLFKASEFSNTKIDIAGNYWPEFQICKNFNDLVLIVKEFFENGKPSDLFNWIYFSDED